MTKFENGWGIHIREGVWLKYSLSQLGRGDGVGVSTFNSESLMAHMEVAGGYVKQIWLVLGWARGWQVKTIVLY
jgi:hypothetical protein